MNRIYLHSRDTYSTLDKTVQDRRFTIKDLNKRSDANNFVVGNILNLINFQKVVKGGEGGGLDHVSWKIKRSFHNSRKI